MMTNTPPDLENEKSTSKVLMGITIILVLASFGIWVYGWSGLAKRERLDIASGEMRNDAADLFDSSDFSKKAEKICENTQTEIDKIPNATQAETPQARSKQIQDATLLLQNMVNEIKLIETSTNRDSQIVAGWLSDWETAIKDRDRYTLKLDKGEDTEFLMTDIPGERLDKRITRLATTNKMTSCSFPADVG